MVALSMLPDKYLEEVFLGHCVATGWVRCEHWQGTQLGVQVRRRA